MTSQSAEPRPNVRRYIALFAAQLVLAAAAVIASLMDRGRSTTGIIIVAAAANALVVAVGFMGVRRDGWIVSTLVMCTALFIAGLLFWPAWDVYERITGF